jgi:hypothetical protein
MPLIWCLLRADHQSFRQPTLMTARRMAADFQSLEEWLI